VTNHTRPLCVDLDGSLCRSDTLLESLLLLLKRQPLQLLKLLGWLRQGRAHFKQQIARYVLPDVASLPWNHPLGDWLKSQHAQGRILVLCTGADRRIAEAAATHWGIFAEVLCSDGKTNLTSERKRAALVQRYGERGFDYVGNASADLAVWRSAQQAVVVAPQKLQRQAAELTTVEQHFAPDHGPRWRVWLKAMRLHQWAKNALVFVPMLVGGVLTADALTASLTAFLAFGLCASSVYLFNDLLDLEADRSHPRKRERPLAAATLPLTHGVLAVPLLLALSVALALTTPILFVLTLLGYYSLTLLYSFALKRFSVVDVISLAALYTLRLIAGGAATDIRLSFWLLAFSMSVFLSLGVVKRYAEIHEAKTSGRKLKGRGYRIDDLPLLANFGVSAGYGAVLVMALYINSAESMLRFAHPERLWLLCPLLLFWISRVWVRTHRGQMHDDPVVFALRDRVSQVVLISAVLLFAAASLH
jgi:4-hydroxybenzoate polyprenyltransferase